MKSMSNLMMTAGCCWCIFTVNNVFAAPQAKNTQFPEVQAYIDSVASKDSLLEEFNIYTVLTGISGLSLLGSNDLSLLGKKGDPEDIEVMQKNKVVTLKDPDDSTIIDITYPISINGKPVAVAGLMFRPIKGKSTTEVVAIANAKAKKIINGFITKIQQSAKPLW